MKDTGNNTTLGFYGAEALSLIAFRQLPTHYLSLLLAFMQHYIHVSVLLICWSDVDRNPKFVLALCPALEGQTDRRHFLIEVTSNNNPHFIYKRK